MARSSLSKSFSNSNFNSRRHLLVYQKCLYTGCQMASLLKDCDNHLGLPAAADLANEWESLIEQLAEVLL